MSNKNQEIIPWKNTPECPDDWYGFVYCITNLETGLKYIGRKYFHIYKKGKRVSESNWKTYTSSSKEVNADIKSFGISKFSFEILSVYKTRQEVNYAEVEEQVKRNVLKSILPSGEFEYYNKNIMSKFFRPKDYGTPEYQEKIEALSKAQKERYLTQKHPMLGKVHPNKGKKLPQTGHKAALGTKWITNGSLNKKITTLDLIPIGWFLGITKKPVTKTKKLYKRICPNCRNPFEVSSKQRAKVYCSSECQEKFHSERMKIKYKNGELRLNK